MLTFRPPKSIFHSSKLNSKKVCLNDVDFLLIEITSKKLRRNDVDFSHNKIT